jgi:hypothetical protein
MEETSRGVSVGIYENVGCGTGLRIGVVEYKRLSEGVGAAIISELEVAETNGGDGVAPRGLELS